MSPLFAFAINSSSLINIALMKQSTIESCHLHPVLVQMQSQDGSIVKLSSMAASQRYTPEQSSIVPSED